MVDLLALALETNRTIGHLSLALSCADFATQVCLAALAELALSALSSV
jgi:hypothetical protein